MSDAESFADQLDRLEQMASTPGEDEIWDLSVNDQAAIRAVLTNRAALLAALDALAKTLHGQFDQEPRTRYTWIMENVDDLLREHREGPR